MSAPGFLAADPLFSNGIDTEVWDPARDPHIARPYSAADLAGKAACRADLLARTGLATGADSPLFGFIGRLVAQKGIDLVLALLPWMADRGLGLAVLGRGEPRLHDALARARAISPSALHVTHDFDDPHAHRIEAGADDDAVDGLGALLDEARRFEREPQLWRAQNRFWRLLCARVDEDSARRLGARLGFDPGAVVSHRAQLLAGAPHPFDGTGGRKHDASYLLPESP